MVFTSDSFYVDLDMTGGSWEYWITAVDSAGNESDATDPDPYYLQIRRR